MKKEPVWELLISKGFFEDKKTVDSWILAGSIFVNNNRIDTPGYKVYQTDEIRIKGYDQKYVSKGGLKLEGALLDFHIDTKGIVALDTGASTGGFTDCLIQHGASKVYAVDVGFGQLAGRLRIEPRVVNMEKVNISEVDPDSLLPKPALATVDLSYMSLKTAIPIIANILKNEGELICLVKPLFEVQNSVIRRTGQIDDICTYKELLIELYKYIDGIGHKVIGITHSHVTGNKGTREFFLRIKINLQNSDYSYNEYLTEVDKAIKCVMKIDTFKKQ